MVGEAELLRRAREVAASLDLGYMSASGEYDPRAAEGSNPFVQPVARFIIHTLTDGWDDGWVHFYATPEQLAAGIAELITDEWGLHSAFDLEAERYAREIRASATVWAAGATIELELPVRCLRGGNVRVPAPPQPTKGSPATPAERPAE